MRAGAILETLELAQLVTRARSVMVEHGLSGTFAAVGLGNNNVGNNNFSRVKKDAKFVTRLRIFRGIVRLGRGSRAGICVPVPEIMWKECLICVVR